MVRRWDETSAVENDPPVPAIGLARLPQELRRLLDEAATSAEAAASLFHRAVDARDRAAIGELERLELEAHRITDDFVRRLRQPRLSSGDRVRLLGLARTVDDTFDGLAAAAHGVIDCDCGDHGRDLASVVRDAVRAEARALRLFAAQTGAGADDRGTGLEHERRRIQRRAFVADADGADAVLAAIRRRSCIEELGRAFDAALRALEALDRARAAGV